MKRLLLGSVALVAMITGSAGISSGAFAQSSDIKSTDSLESENAALRARVRRLEAENENAALRTRLRQLQTEGHSAVAAPAPAGRRESSNVQARLAGAEAYAADLPVKAKPAEYVKVCNLYGEGFYQIPGEGDICIKIGATVRLDAALNANGDDDPFLGNGADARNNRIDTREFLFEGRGTVWFDARQMTQFGVLKAYFRRRL
jgi:hypothetical protein